MYVKVKENIYSPKNFEIWIQLFKCIHDRLNDVENTFCATKFYSSFVQKSW